MNGISYDESSHSQYVQNVGMTRNGKASMMIFSDALGRWRNRPDGGSPRNQNKTKKNRGE